MYTGYIEYTNPNNSIMRFYGDFLMWYEEHNNTVSCLSISSEKATGINQF